MSIPLTSANMSFRLAQKTDASAIAPQQIFATPATGAAYRSTSTSIPITATPGATENSAVQIPHFFCRVVLTALFEKACAACSSRWGYLCRRLIESQGKPKLTGFFTDNFP
eukprot:IDg4961t1